MSFRKRNISLLSPKDPVVRPNKAEQDAAGIRPSPLDGRLTTSTGTRSLDSILAGHAGIAMGTSLLIEENGVTDFGGVLLRYFASEGIAQGHHVHVLGADETWGRDLPGLKVPKNESSAPKDDIIKGEDKMKIAWRYERLGEFGRGRASGPSSIASSDTPAGQPIFCHEFDLSRRLVLPSDPLLSCIAPTQRATPDFLSVDSARSPFEKYLKHIQSQIALNPPSTIHRVVVPALFSPAIYTYTASTPHHVLHFLHALRALNRRYPLQLTVMISLPTSLFPRTTGLTRWVEILCDGVVEIMPFPSSHIQIPAAQTKVAPGQEENPQGMLKLHRLPVLHERGGGAFELDGLEGDLAFTLSRRKGFVIKPFSLPPVDGDTEVQNIGAEENRINVKKVDLEF